MWLGASARPVSTMSAPAKRADIPVIDSAVSTGATFRFGDFDDNHGIGTLCGLQGSLDHEEISLYS